MTRFHGVVGYVTTQETEEGSGIWEDVVTERSYFGDVEQNIRKLDSAGEKVLDNVLVQNMISIVADAYAMNHFFSIRYVEWAGTKWTVQYVEVERPRLLLRLGKVYNGPTA